MDLINFGNKLKKLRLQNHMTQQQLASLMGVTKSVVSYYELQERIPSPEMLIKLSTIFHVSTDYLLGISSDNSINISGLNDDDIAVLSAIINLLRDKNSKIE